MKSFNKGITSPKLLSIKITIQIYIYIIYFVDQRRSIKDKRKEKSGQSLLLQANLKKEKL